MRQRYKEEVERINKAAAFFACRGYHVDTTFHSNYNSIALCIFFNQENERETIENHLNCYAGENDTVAFHEHIIGKNAKFYTLTLTTRSS